MRWAEGPPQVSPLLLGWEVFLRLPPHRERGWGQLCWRVSPADHGLRALPRTEGRPRLRPLPSCSPRSAPTPAFPGGLHFYLSCLVLIVRPERSSLLVLHYLHIIFLKYMYICIFKVTHKIIKILPVNVDPCEALVGPRVKCDLRLDALVSSTDRFSLVKTSRSLLVAFEVGRVSSSTAALSCGEAAASCHCHLRAFLCPPVPHHPALNLGWTFWSPQ